MPTSLFRSGAALGSPVELSVKCYKRWAACFRVAVGQQLPCCRHAVAWKTHQEESQLAPVGNTKTTVVGIGVSRQCEMIPQCSKDLSAL